MESSCLCDSSDASERTEYLDALKKKYLDRTSKLQAQQQELEKRIMQMEIFLGDKENNDNSGASTCSCDTRAIPKVFPEAPVRDVSGINVLSPIKSELQPVVQTCSFFQKIMDNARSILSMKCQCASAFVSAKSTSVTVKDGGTSSEFTPTREYDSSAPRPEIAEDETTATDRSSKTSICTCDESNSTLMEISCSCNLESQKVPQVQQVSNDSSTRHKNQDPNSNKSTVNSRHGVPTKDCPFYSKNATASEASSCSCEMCVCTLENDKDESQIVTIPKIADGGDNITAGIQTASTNQTMAFNNLMPKETFNVATACCKSQMCPTNQGPMQKQCGGSCNTLPVNQPVADGLKLAQFTQNLPSGQDEVVFDACFKKCEATRQDGQNQCAFVGSPLLNPMALPIAEQLQTTGSKGHKPVGENVSCSLTSQDIVEMQNIAELATKEKQMKAQIEELRKREQQYQQVTKNMNTLVSKTADECCCYQSAHQPVQGMQDQIKRISQELRLENQYLKTELLDLKVELKHCLEKVEGPMKQKLQTEKQKCELLQSELQQASKNMLLSQDTYTREMTQLKLQLCCACANITELNEMNGRLKEEMSQLDCLCGKLEDDLVKQKINEADTIKRLTSRRLSGDGLLMQKSEELGSHANLDSIARKLSNTIKELAPCEECSTLPPELAGAAKCIKELTDLVRKRRTRSSNSGGCCCEDQPSKQMSEDECCTCCSGPKDRGDKRVESSKVRKNTTTPSQPCGCLRHSKPASNPASKPASKPSSKGFLAKERVLCTCTYSARDGGGDPSGGTKTPDEKAVRTLLSVPKSFVQNGISSKFNVGAAASSYYSASGEPTRDDAFQTSSKIGAPIMETKGTVTQKETISKADLPPASHQDEAIMCRALACKGTVTVPVDISKRDIQIDVQREDVAQDVPSKKSMSCAKIGMPCQQKKDSPKESILKQNGPIEDVLKEGLPSEKTSKKASSFTKIGEPSQTDKEPMTDVTTETQINTAEKGIKAPCKRVMGLKDIGSEMEGVSKVSKSIITDIAQISHEIIDRMAIPEGERETSKSPKKYMYGNRSQGIGYEDNDEYGETIDDAETKEHPASPLRELLVEEVRQGPEFPVDIEVKAYGIDEPPDGLHVTTTVTESGTLEIITEGPGGVIETVMTYTDEGNIEVVTEMIEYEDQKSVPTEHALEKYTTEPSLIVAGVPEEASSVEKMSSTAFVDEPPMSDEDGRTKSKLKPILPVLSSKFSGPSGPETETPYTPSTTSGEDALTSNLGTNSSGIKALVDTTLDFVTGEVTEATAGRTATRDEDMKTPEGFPEVTIHLPFGAESIPSSGSKTGKSADATTKSAQDAIRQDMGQIDGLLSEGVTSTGVDMSSGEVFTPEQGISDVDDESPNAVDTANKSGQGPISTESKTSGSGAPTSLNTGNVETQRSSILDYKSVKFEKGTEAQVEISVDLGVDAASCPATAASTTTGTASKSEPTLDEKRVPDTSSTGPSKTRDCSCQSKDQKDQSCQCCECKTIGVTTSGDKETITTEDEEMCKTQAEETKTDTDSEFVTTSEITDNAYAQRPEKPTTTASRLEAPKSDWGLILDDQMLEKHPELIGRTAEEQHEILLELGYVTSTKDIPQDQGLLNEELITMHPELGTMSKSEREEFKKEILEKHPELEGLSQEELQEMLHDLYKSNATQKDEIVVNNSMLEQHPELLEKSKEEQQEILKSLGYAPSKPSHVDRIKVDENVLEMHPELVGKSDEEQQRILKAAGYVASNKQIVVDEEMIEKHPELAGKSSALQQEILENLGYATPLAPSIIIDKPMLEKHPELVGKTSEQQERILESLGYTNSKTASKVIDESMLEKHPELVGKTSEQQEQILESLGYKTLETASKVIDESMLEKHPELVGKTSEQQEQILKSLGYKSPETASKVIDEAMLEKHPELVGKTSEQQEQTLESLGYKTPETASKVIDKAMLEKHPELVGKTSELQEQILKSLGYKTPETSSKVIDEAMLEIHPELVGKTSEQQEQILESLGYKTPKTASKVIDEAMLEKHPELVGKTSEQQEQILKSLGYKTPETASKVIDEAMLEKHPELVGKTSEQQEQILKSLGYKTPDTASKVIDESMLEKHPELVGKTSEQQEQILESLGYKTPKTASKVIDESMLEKHPELVGKTSEQQEQILESLGYKTPETASKVIDEAMLEKHPELVGKTSEQQEQILESLGYKTPKTASKVIDEAMLEKHPELVGKTSEQQEQILESLGYKNPETVSKVIDEAMLERHPELVGKTSEQQEQILESLGYKTPETASKVIDEAMLEKHPELVGKTSEQQEQILESLGYKTPETASKVIDEDMLEKYPELVGKTSKQQEQILESLGYETPKTASKVIDESMLKKHPELVNKTSQQQEQILESLGYKTSKAASKVIDENILEKHPALLGKTSEQQEQILKSLGYKTPETASKVIDESMLEKHPELVGKTSEQQEQILESLGYKTSKTASKVIDEAMLERHPELVGKTSEEKYCTPTASVTIDKNILVKYPDLVGKSSEQQQQILENLEYVTPKGSSITEGKKIPTDLGYMPKAVTCKAPCKTKKGLDILRSKPKIQVRQKEEDEYVIKIDQPQPYSKEVSISCKASCRSAATIHDDSKSSEKEVTIGDSSYASRSISLQQTPSSRDDSASVIPSNRAISIQCSARKDVEVLEAARSGSSSTASSTDSREKEIQKGKNRKEDKKKGKPGEVPSIVSELSDKDRPVIEPTKKSRTQRKKRSARLVPDCLKCSCEEPCICKVCSPDDTRHQRKINRPVRSCDCPSAPVPPKFPMASSMPLPSSSHAPTCGCNQCIFNPFTCHPGLVGRSMVDGESPTSDDMDGKKFRRHSSKCECVDCLCLPKIKKLAETREYPVVYDRKQVYHVKTNCGTCENAQNASRYVDQQRSRIPISTTTPNPPRVKPDSKPAVSSSKVAAPENSEVAAPQAIRPPITGQLSQSDSIYNSIACDCDDCKCTDCPDPKRKKTVLYNEKNDKSCCCEGPCVCKPCNLEELTRQLQEAHQKLAAATQPISGTSPALAATSHHTPVTAARADAPDADCSCTECKCPMSHLMPGKAAPAQIGPTQTAPPPTAATRPSEECTCPECVTCPRSDLIQKGRGLGDPPGKPSVTIKPSETGDEEECTCPECVCVDSDISPGTLDSAVAHPPDCDCAQCTCPEIDKYKKQAPTPAALPPQVAAGGGDDDCDCTVCACPGKTSLPPVGLADCDCHDCVCSPCGDEKKKKGEIAAGEVVPQLAGLADCDCVDCKCSPCADPNKAKGARQVYATGPIAKASEKDIHPVECDCPVCSCPGAGDILPSESRATGMPEKIAHPPDCDCHECLCLEEIIKTELVKDHPVDCDCPVCTCPVAGDIPGKAGIDKAVHPNECDCDDCKCPPPEMSQVREQQAVDKGIHAPDCDCDECKCSGSAEQATHALTCACPECLCPECAVKVDHAPGCRCDACLCQECDYKPLAGAGLTPLSARMAGVPSVHPGDCSCIKCVCDRCSDPSKQKDAPHAEGCKCIECLCKECLQKLEPLKHEPGCTCTQCTCVECLRKMSTGDQLGTDTQECVEARHGDIGDNCTCENCMCIDCSGKKGTGIAVQGAALGGAQAAHGGLLGSGRVGDTLQPSHDDKCTCVMCQCDPCPTKEEQQPCTCSVCTCLECTKEHGITAKAANLMGDTRQPTHDDKCTCAICQCDPCPTKEEQQPCTCPVCTCLECTKKRGISAHDTKRDVGMGERDIGMGDKGMHSPECECPVCQCPGGAGAAENVQQVTEYGPADTTKCICAPVCKCESIGDTTKVGNIAQQRSGIAPQTSGIAQQRSGIAPQTSGVAQQRSGIAPQSSGVAQQRSGIAPQVSIIAQKKSGIDQQKSVIVTQSSCIEQQRSVIAQQASCVDQKKSAISAQASQVQRQDGNQYMMDPPPFQLPQRIDCDCNNCACVICAHSKGAPTMRAQASHISGVQDREPPPFEIPVRMDCNCLRCDCVFCNKQGPRMKEMGAQPSMNRTLESQRKMAGKEVSVQPSQFTSQPTATGMQQMQQAGSVHAAGNANLDGAIPMHCDCPTCTCNEGELKTTMFTSQMGPPGAPKSTYTQGVASQAFQSIDTLDLPKPTMDAHMTKLHPQPCDCPQCHCIPCPDQNAKFTGPPTQAGTPEIGPARVQESVKHMDNVTLARSIQAANKENCECKEQIEEIKKTLERIKCACTEAEFRSTQNIAQQMGAANVLPGKPFVKQASVFGQTMSGLKMALANLQSKCKAKDKMIEAMTGELEIRADRSVFDKIIDRAQNPVKALDYDQAEDVPTMGISQFSTNVIYGKTMADQSTAPCDVRCVASKGVEVRTHKHKKKKGRSAEVGLGKKSDDCCSKPLITQREEKDCQKLDLSGFEVIDIRRITDDSLIVKWTPPKCKQVSGYDIFVNGTLSSKVMSGSRTSAMMHSLDLSKSVQITIYAVSKCGRIEPPAIAIYEIKTV